MNAQNLYRVSFFKIGRISILSLFFMWVACMQMSAQNSVTRILNGMRPGDCLIKQQVEYIDPGRDGAHVLWDFSKQKLLDGQYRLSYDGVEDSLVVGQEHRALYTYLFRGDSLLLAGIQNRTMLVNHLKPELQLIFPVKYGDHHEDYFHGNGDYGDHLFVTIRGKVTVKADAYGMMLLPQGDTLRNVLRVRHLKSLSEQMVPYPFILPGDTVYSPDSVEHRLAADTLLVQVETYRWYAPGWRYPVFETVSNRFVLRGEAKEYSRSSFCYKPVDQYYDLAADPLNQATREKARNSADQANDGEQQEGCPDGQSPDVINYSAGLSDGNNTLTLDYWLNEETEVSIMLFDMQGRQLSEQRKGKQAAGPYQASFSLYGFQPGEYTLRIVAGNKVFGIKIIK